MCPVIAILISTIIEMYPERDSKLEVYGPLQFSSLVSHNPTQQPQFKNNFVSYFQMMYSVVLAECLRDYILQALATFS